MGEAFLIKPLASTVVFDAPHSALLTTLPAANPAPLHVNTETLPLLKLIARTPLTSPDIRWIDAPSGGIPILAPPATRNISPPLFRSVCINFTRDSTSAPLILRPLPPKPKSPFFIALASVAAAFCSLTFAATADAADLSADKAASARRRSTVCTISGVMSSSPGRRRKSLSVPGREST